jgi:hypothetical protein
MTEYLLMKRGYYYRPKAQGYTSSLLEAGLYSAEESLERCEKSDGVTRRRLIDALDDIDAERQKLRARLDELDDIERRALGLRESSRVADGVG